MNDEKMQDVAAANLNALVINLLGNDEKVDELLSKLNEIAKESSSYEYGLPMYDEGQKERLRKSVLKWLAAAKADMKDEA